MRSVVSAVVVATVGCLGIGIDWIEKQAGEHVKLWGTTGTGMKIKFTASRSCQGHFKVS